MGRTEIQTISLTCDGCGNTVLCPKEEDVEATMARGWLSGTVREHGPNGGEAEWVSCHASHIRKATANVLAQREDDSA